VLVVDLDLFNQDACLYFFCFFVYFFFGISFFVGSNIYIHGAFIFCVGREFGCLSGFLWIASVSEIVGFKLCVRVRARSVVLSRPSHSLFAHIWKLRRVAPFFLLFRLASLSWLLSCMSPKSQNWRVWIPLFRLLRSFVSKFWMFCSWDFTGAQTLEMLGPDHRKFGRYKFPTNNNTDIVDEQVWLAVPYLILHLLSLFDDMLCLHSNKCNDSKCTLYDVLCHSRTSCW